ncbi:hypothetical protein [Timonella senegalensis]|uniref:hypothetical protein n=1 Tax=Timonella senegalensis TaxID=1465825 RepID=UPI0002D719E8|nr:hypothetical protein [Timonella senegalensis]
MAVKVYTTTSTGSPEEFLYPTANLFFVEHGDLYVSSPNGSVALFNEWVRAEVIDEEGQQ